MPGIFFPRILRLPALGLTSVDGGLMDSDRIAGSAKRVKGTLKQAVGTVVGNGKLELQGRADRVEGKIQNAIGTLKNTLKGK